MSTSILRGFACAKPRRRVQ